MHTSMPLLLLLVLLLLADSAQASAPSVALVGATGNLAAKYLWQALFDLHREGLVGKVYGGATKPPEKGTGLIMGVIDEKVKCPAAHPSAASCTDATVAEFKESVTYVQLRGEDHYAALAETIKADDAEGLLVYLSVSPDYYGDISAHISAHLRPAVGDGWMRVVMEKPFGRDSASASALAEAVDAQLRPEEVCKVDHYLGKAAVNDIASFRGANRATYEPLLSHRFVQEIEVVMQETEDCEGRTAFFERYGIVRDVLQNHLSEMLGLATGELEPVAPGLTGADLVNRTALLIDVPAPSMAEATFGQYAGYKQHVAEDGGTEADAPTAAVVNLKIDSARWRGVPITMKVGKTLDTREAFLRIVFKQDAFPKNQPKGPGPPELRFQIQGGAGAMISVSSALPMPDWPAGWEAVDGPASIPHQRSAALVATPPPAYHVLMRAAVLGKMGSFVSTEELMELWRVWTPLVAGWDGQESPRPVVYTPGSARADWVSATQDAQGKEL